MRMNEAGFEMVEIYCALCWVVTPLRTMVFVVLMQVDFPVSVRGSLSNLREAGRTCKDSSRGPDVFTHAQVKGFKANLDARTQVASRRAAVSSGCPAKASVVGFAIELNVRAGLGLGLRVGLEIRVSAGH
jgi:hypothetical protein